METQDLAPQPRVGWTPLPNPAQSWLLAKELEVDSEQWSSGLQGRAWAEMGSDFCPFCVSGWEFPGALTALWGRAAYGRGCTGCLIKDSSQSLVLTFVHSLPLLWMPSPLPAGTLYFAGPLSSPLCQVWVPGG